jgi:energy-coupling factor transporter ATP-binding protein EcfA2
MKMLRSPNRRYGYWSLAIVTLCVFTGALWAKPATPVTPAIQSSPAPSVVPTSSATPAPIVITPKAPYQSAIDWGWNSFVQPLGKNSADKIVGAIVAGAGTFAGVSWRYARKKARSVFHDFPSRDKERGHLVLLLGQTDSGKTTLIKQAFSYPTRQTGAPNPRRPTDDVSIYTVLQETMTSRSTETYRYDIIDYRGSDPGSLARQWNGVVKNLRFKEITAVILVVDIFNVGNVQREQEQADPVQLNQLIAYWTGCLNALAGNVGQRPELAVLFINKLDLLKGVPMRSIVEGGGNRIPAIRSRLQPLEEAMKRTFGLEIDVIAGSLQYGIGVNELLAKLRELSQTYPK